MTDITRRRFVKTVAGTGAALTIVPRHVLGRGFQAPSDTVNVAAVGIGGMRRQRSSAVLSQNIVAICDVDDGLAREAVRRPTSARRTSRHRRAAVAIARLVRSSPAQVAANQRRPATDEMADLRKFVDGPMTEGAALQGLPRDAREAEGHRRGHRRDARSHARGDRARPRWISASTSTCRSRSAGRCTKRGTSRRRRRATRRSSRRWATRATRGTRRGTGYEYITAGAIGDVREVHVWTNRPLGYWPQGIPRPGAAAAAAPDRPLPLERTGHRRAARGRDGRQLSRCPTGLSWDLFLGVAPDVEYHPVYHPFNWRGWVDWGQGALGDMGAHLIDHPIWALDLGMPDDDRDASRRRSTASAYPNATMTYYEFPARGSMPAVKLTWYDGGLLPPKPDELGDGRS